MKPYPKYKEAGLPWLKVIPAHWELKPNRSVISRKKILVGEAWKQYQMLSLTKAGVIVRDVESGKGKFSADLGTSQEIKRGDIIFCLFDVPETPRTVGLSKHDGMITGAYTVFEFPCPEVAPFFERYYMAMDDGKYLSPLYSGLRNTISCDKFLSTKTPFPPISEQQAIASFLDRKTAKIDEVIKATEESIELLQEERKTIISHAVTKGLDPKAKMRDSGVEWLGEVPEHWGIAKTARFFKVAMGQTILKEDLIDDGEFPVFSATEGDHYFGRINSPRVRLDVGDLVIPARGTIGAVKLVKEPSTTSQTTIYCKNLAVDRLRQSYAYYFMRGLKDMLFYFTQTAIPQITVEEVCSNPIMIPPLSEQEAIASYLDEKTSQIDSLITEKRGLIESLQEYRSSLIHEAVTGKIDLREEAA